MLKVIRGGNSFNCEAINPSPEQATCALRIVQREQTMAASTATPSAS